MSTPLIIKLFGGKRTFPRASRAPSKKSITPKSMNSPPKVVKATPISVFFFLVYNFGQYNVLCMGSK